ncbi:MAG: hypothetical protein QF515_16535 [Pseudomonadales bacterium]|nr:hypothetical protein [Pseudomonadales bacterium]
MDLTAASALVKRQANLAYGPSPHNRLRVLRDTVIAKPWGWIIYSGDG